MTCKRFWRIRIEKYIRVRHKTHKNSLSILKPQIFRILERALILFKWYSYLLCAISLKTLLHPRTNLPEKAISNLPKRWDNYPSKAFIFEFFSFILCFVCVSISSIYLFFLPKPPSIWVITGHQETLTIIYFPSLNCRHDEPRIVGEKVVELIYSQPKQLSFKPSKLSKNVYKLCWNTRFRNFCPCTLLHVH